MRYSAASPGLAWLFLSITILVLVWGCCRDEEPQPESPCARVLPASAQFEMFEIVSNEVYTNEQYALRFPQNDDRSWYVKYMNEYNYIPATDTVLRFVKLVAKDTTGTRYRWKIGTMPRVIEGKKTLVIDFDYVGYGRVPITLYVEKNTADTCLTEAERYDTLTREVVSVTRAQLPFYGDYMVTESPQGSFEFSVVRPARLDIVNPWGQPELEGFPKDCSTSADFEVCGRGIFLSGNQQHRLGYDFECEQFRCYGYFYFSPNNTFEFTGMLPSSSRPEGVFYEEGNPRSVFKIKGYRIRAK
jgi:hypothetical protein